MTDAERQSNQELKPKEEEQPSEDDISFWEFWEAVKKSEAEAEAAAVLHIKKAATDGTWQAAAWYLERKYKDRWGRQDRVSHEGTINHSLGLQASEKEIEAVRMRLKAARSLPAAEETEVIDAEIVDKKNDEKV